MSSKFHDPNNHVPDVSAEDEWGDSSIPVESSDGTGLASLPPKRPAEGKKSVRAPGLREIKNDEDKGLQIDVKPLEVLKQATAGGKSQVTRLEVQEHISKLMVPEVAPLPKVVPKVVMEKPEEPEVPEGEEDWLPKQPDANWGKTKSVPVKWLLLSGGVVAILLITLAILLPKMGWKDELRETSRFNQVEVDNSTAAPKSVNGSEFTDTFEDEVRKLAIVYATAKTADEILPFVRNRDRVEPILRSHWMPLNAPANWEFPSDTSWALLKTLSGLEYGTLSGTLPDFKKFRFYFVQDGPRILLDWEASTAYSETSFEGLSKNQGEGGVVRGTVTPANFYTFSLPENDYQCFRITSPDLEISVWGYAKRDSPENEKLVSLFVQGPIPREIAPEYGVTLRLAKAPEDSMVNQWIITEMLHIDWLTP